MSNTYASSKPENTILEKMSKHDLVNQLKN